MDAKKLEIFNNIVLLSNKKISRNILHIDNTESVIKHLRQNRLLISQGKKSRLKWETKFRIVICFSDLYLIELATLIKSKIFFEKNARYDISIMESKDFYMNIPHDIKLVVFIGKIDSRYISFCLHQEIFLINVVLSTFYNKTDVYNLPFKIDNLSALVWILLFYKNI